MRISVPSASTPPALWSFLQWRIGTGAQMAAKTKWMPKIPARADDRDLDTKHAVLARWTHGERIFRSFYYAEKIPNILWYLPQWYNEYTRRCYPERLLQIIRSFSFFKEAFITMNIILMNLGNRREGCAPSPKAQKPSGSNYKSGLALSAFPYSLQVIFYRPYIVTLPILELDWMAHQM